VSPKDLALAMVVLKHLLDVASKSQASLRQNAAEELDASDRVTARSPVDGTLLGSITKSKAKPKVVVTDPDALLDWVEQHYPDRVSSVEFIDERVMDEAIGFLMAHGGSQFVSTTVSLSPYTLSEITKLSEKAGVPVGPGGELGVPGVRVDFPEGNVSVRLEPEVHEAIVAVIQSGHVSLDGTVHLELPGGTA
jgi:hypothetical protein